MDVVNFTTGDEIYIGVNFGGGVAAMSIPIPNYSAKNGDGPMIIIRSKMSR